MGCFEDLMDFREAVENLKRERGGKMTGEKGVKMEAEMIDRS